MKLSFPFHFSAVWINLPLSIFAVTLCALCGCVIYAFYADCDPISNKQIKKGDQVIIEISVKAVTRTAHSASWFVFYAWQLQGALVFKLNCLYTCINKEILIKINWFFTSLSLDPAIFCDACLRVLLCYTWFIYGMLVQWDTQVHITSLVYNNNLYSAKEWVANSSMSLLQMNKTKIKIFV